MNTLWLRELCRFMLVDAVLRLASPSASRRKMSPSQLTYCASQGSEEEEEGGEDEEEEGGSAGDASDAADA